MFCLLRRLEEEEEAPADEEQLLFGKGPPQAEKLVPRKSGGGASRRVAPTVDAVVSLLLVLVFVWTCLERKCSNAAVLIPATFDRRPQKWAAPASEAATTSLPRELGPTSGGAANSSANRVLCWILTVDSDEHRTKTRAIEETWGRRCDKLLFVSGGKRLSLTASDRLSVPIEREGRDQLWRKVIEAFEFIHAKYLAEFDWFMKADDDTYVLVDSLRSFLARKQLEPNYTESVYFGHRFAPFVRQGYMSGGSGYVLSKAALVKLVQFGFARKLSECHLSDGQIEDVEIGECLEAVGVEAGDTRDAAGKETFLPLSPLQLLDESLNFDDFWYFKYAYYKQHLKLGKQSCSERPISFHYIEPEQMRLIDWLLYDVKVGRAA